MQNHWYGPLNTNRMQQNAVKNQQNQIVAVLSLLQAILVAAI